MAGTMSSGGGRRGRAGIVGINVTPMVDVVLVLLVIMMVSATFIVSQSIHVDLPRTASADSTVNSTATVTIARTRATYFNDQPVDEHALIERLRGAYESNQDVNVVVTADRDVSHGTVMHVIDLAKLAGITHFAINVEHAE